MVRLKRTVRMTINPGEDPDEPGRNGYAGKPVMRGLGRYYEFDAVCTGEPDPATGYLINIKTIDSAVRTAVAGPLRRLCNTEPETDPQTLITAFASRVRAELGPVQLTSLAWRLTPYFSLEAVMPETEDASTRVLIRQRFDFAAAHRLHTPELSDEENRATFGRCNNPSGHGHNYQVEPCVEVTPGKGFSLDTLERITDETVIDPFDHTHLNEDADDFRTGLGVNPSVENIARVFYQRLAPAIAQTGAGNARLINLTVWETDRTSATYPANCTAS